MPDVFLLTGSNRGDRKQLLQSASEKLQAVLGTVRTSSLYESEPWGFDDDTPFYNQVLQFYTSKSAEEVLELCLRIEQELGRTRHTGKGYAARTIDIDILFYGTEVILTEQLTVPHPKLHRRRFTLAPLAEIVPIFRHPMMHLTMQELLDNCTDNLPVKRLPDEV